MGSYRTHKYIGYSMLKLDNGNMQEWAIIMQPRWVGQVENVHLSPPVQHNPSFQFFPQPEVQDDPLTEW